MHFKEVTGRYAYFVSDHSTHSTTNQNTLSLISDHFQIPWYQVVQVSGHPVGIKSKVQVRARPHVIWLNTHFAGHFPTRFQNARAYFNGVWNGDIFKDIGLKVKGMDNIFRKCAFLLNEATETGRMSDAAHGWKSLPTPDLNSSTPWTWFQLFLLHGQYALFSPQTSVNRSRITLPSKTSSKWALVFKL